MVNAQGICDNVPSLLSEDAQQKEENEENSTAPSDSRVRSQPVELELIELPDGTKPIS